MGCRVLTGPAIRRAIESGDITIDPFVPQHVGPNSCDVTLADDLLVYNVVGPAFPQRHTYDGTKIVDSYVDECGALQARPQALDARADNPIERFGIDPKGAVLLPGVLYLGRTVERVHSDVYSSTIHGRSSVGRLGVVVHQTAAFIDVGFDGVVTLEITVTHPVRIYAGMRIAQIAFHPLVGEIELYRGKYQGARDVEASKMHRDKEAT